MASTVRAARAVAVAADTPTRGLSDEERFREWKNRASAQHPLYSTAAAEVGKIPRGVTLELKPPEHGKGAAKFSETFLGGPRRDTGLNTTMTKHRYLKELDGAV